MNFTFVDLNAKYEKQRRADISQQSKKIINLVGEALKQQVKAEKRRIFRIFLDQGGSLDLLQLKQLSTTLKRDYTSKVMETHEQTNSYCLQVIDDCLEKNDEISEMIWGIVDTKDTWDQAIDSINKAINRKA